MTSIDPTSPDPKKITWKTALVPIEGLSIQNYLNRLNFQPGKFLIIPGVSNVTILYVEKEEEL